MNSETVDCAELKPIRATAVRIVTIILIIIIFVKVSWWNESGLREAINEWQVLGYAKGEREWMSAALWYKLYMRTKNSGVSKWESDQRSEGGTLPRLMHHPCAYSSVRHYFSYSYLEPRWYTASDLWSFYVTIRVLSIVTRRFKRRLMMSNFVKEKDRVVFKLSIVARW